MMAHPQFRSLTTGEGFAASQSQQSCNYEANSNSRNLILVFVCATHLLYGTKNIKVLSCLVKLKATATYLDHYLLFSFVNILSGITIIKFCYTTAQSFLTKGFGNTGCEVVFGNFRHLVM